MGRRQGRLAATSCLCTLLLLVAGAAATIIDASQAQSFKLLSDLAAKAQDAAAGKLTNLQDVAKTSEEALAHMTSAFVGLMSQAAAAATSGTPISANGTTPLDAMFKGAANLDTMKQGLAELAANTFGGLGKNILSVDDKGNLNLNLEHLLGIDGSANATLGLDISELLNKAGTGGLLQEVQKLVNVDFAATFDDFVARLRRPYNSALLQAILPFQARVVERLQQARETATAVAAGGAARACGNFLFNPGGDPVARKWTGPTFTLTSTTGACALINELRGVGNIDWTRAVSRLGCLGPSLQYGYTPIKYTGPTRSKTTLTGPECKIIQQFGSTVKVTLYGGDSKDPIKFANEADFYSAVVVNRTFDFHTRGAQTLLKSIQGRIHSGRESLKDILKISTLSPITGETVDALQSLLSGGDAIKNLEAATTDLRAKVAAHYQQAQGDASGGMQDGSWTRSDGSFDPSAFLKGIQDKISTGAFQFKGASATT